MERRHAARHATIMLLLSATVACIGCSSPHEPTVDLVFMPDLSRSIEASARRACAQTIVHASAELGRGDSVAVVPITGAIAEQAPAMVRRYEFGIKRAAFDDDLAQTLASERLKLERMSAGVPSHRTDIFGSLRLAEEELARSPDAGSAIGAIAMLSDFVEDDGEQSFARGRNLASPSAARRFAARVAPDTAKLRGVQIYLGRIPSVSLRRLSERRREAIKAFWIDYLTRQGGRVEWATDGLGELARFVARLTAARPERETVARVLGSEDEQPE
jgi:hypothetical protein